MDPNHRRILAGSPSSSEAVGSPQNTPETKLTAFSPEELRSEQRAVKNGIVRPNVPPAFALNVYSRSSSNDNAGTSSAFASSDPFVGPSSVVGAGLGSNDLPKLSPIATSFTPLGRPNLSLPAAAVKHRDETHDSRATTPRPSATLSTLVSQNTASSAATELAQSSASQTYQPSQTDTSAFTKFGHFCSDNNTSRYLMVNQVARKTSLAELEAFFHKSVFPSMRHLGINELVLTGTIYVSFGDIRDAVNAYTKVQTVRVDWGVSCIGTAQYFMKQNPGQELPSLVYEGQVSVKADYGGPASHFNANSIGIIVKEVLENYGEIMAMEAIEVASPSVTYRAEYYDSTAVTGAFTALQGFKIAGCTLTIRNYGSGENAIAPQPSKNQGPLIIGQEETGLETALGGMKLAPPGMYGREFMASPLVSPYFLPEAPNRSFAYHRELNGTQMPSPLDLQKSSYSGPESAETSPWSPFFSPYVDYGLQSPLWSPYTPGAIGQERGASMLSPYSGVHPYQQRGPGKYLARSPHDYSSGHHNIVDIERIRQGLDVRTTIMLRNIPNKIDQAMLKDIVDETSRGKYDFMYLRIDFANNCNVGYAFINFEDPYYIIDFMNARAGHRWNRFNSDKVAEVSYATIQGRDCLVQKFRNSSVMLEHPSFRPKIFHTGTGPLSGTEDNFPGPDNPSKMRRSVENAEHVGLFAPRAGQNFRDEQRRRRSQYDRGTRLAEMEDAYDIDHHDYRGDLSPYYPGPSLRYRRSSPYLPVFEEY